jgi:hypothetical protein
MKQKIDRQRQISRTQRQLGSLGSIIVTSGKLMKSPGRSRSMLISGLPIFLLQILPKLGGVLIIMPPD